MSDPNLRTEQKTAYHLLWEHYMRTGQRLSGEAAARFLERKTNVLEEPDTQQKSAESVLFEHYLRTGERLTGDAALRFIERKFNPYHDPDDGRFTFKPGGGSLAPRARSHSGGSLGATHHARHGGVQMSSPANSLQSGSRGRSALPGASQSRPGAGPAVRPSEVSDPIGAIIWDSQHPAQARATPAVRPKPPAATEGDAKIRAPWRSKDASVRIPSPLKPKIDAVAVEFHRRTGKSPTVTDGARTSEIQASRMYTKYQLGDFHTYTGVSGRRVEAAWRRAVASGKTRAEVIGEMARVIRSEQANGRLVSKHLTGSGADFSVSGMTSAEIRALINTIVKHGGHPLWEGTPRHVHASF